MAYQKLTYTGTECNSYLYFCFSGEDFDTDVITNRLSIEPTSIRLKKDPIPISTSWNYQIHAGSEIDLLTPLVKLIGIFEPKIEVIKYLKEEFSLDTTLMFVIDIDINPDASTPYFPLNKRTIDFLSKTGTEVNFDIYKADTIGLLDHLSEG